MKGYFGEVNRCHSLANGKAAIRSNILVTGAPRSGTTVLGRMMAFSPEINYLWEPFNLRFRSGIPDYYPYVGKSTPNSKREIYRSFIEDTLRLRRLKANIEIRADDSIPVKVGKKLGINKNALHYWSAQLKDRLLHPACLLCKDPIAIFLSRHLLTSYDFKVVGVIRHPAAITDSRRKLGWKFDFADWKNQDDFYIDHFGAIDIEIQNYDLNDYAVECSFHWLTCYTFLADLQKDFPDKVHLVRHEDICLTPETIIQQVFDFCDLQVGDAMLKKVHAVTHGRQTEKRSGRLADLEPRNARRLVDKWKANVSAADLATIRRITEGVSNKFYPASAYWTIDSLITEDFEK